jgi:NADP-dependent 3-hydroxy acid dehydrogenase YdfG
VRQGALQGGRAKAELGAAHAVAADVTDTTALERALAHAAERAGRPPPCAFMPGTTARAATSTGSRLSAIIRRRVSTSTQESAERAKAELGAAHAVAADVTDTTALERALAHAGLALSCRARRHGRRPAPARGWAPSSAAGCRRRCGRGAERAKAELGAAHAVAADVTDTTALERALAHAAERPAAIARPMPRVAPVTRMWRGEVWVMDISTLKDLAG